MRVVRFLKYLHQQVMAAMRDSHRSEAHTVAGPAQRWRKVGGGKQGGFALTCAMKRWAASDTMRTLHTGRNNIVGMDSRMNPHARHARQLSASAAQTAFKPPPPPAAHVLGSLHS